MIRLGILGSTRGSNLQAMIDAIGAKHLNASIEVIISNKADAYILKRAVDHHLTHHWVDPLDLTRDAYDQNISALLQQYQVDLIVLMGYMRILSASFVTTLVFCC